ncbi:MAG: glutamate racemase [Candidatus Omnitrophica bacterium]|nr:glutamate racemase [Candidatus Omnitrophota bacterium]
MDNQPIGVFDSGIGGLTVLREINRQLPRENLIYFGDTARVPYGNKSKETIIKFSTQNILFLLQKKVKLVVVACNTASSLALDYIQNIFNVPIIGVIEAGVKGALRLSKRKKIGVIGTASTIKSRSYERCISSRSPDAKVIGCSCPLFVPLAEEGIVKGPIARQIIDFYLSKLKKQNLDSVILGCTHYPLLKNEISRYLKPAVVIDSAKEVARFTGHILAERKMFSKRKTKGKIDFYVTDDASGFSRLAKLFFQKKLPLPKIVNV